MQHSPAHHAHEPTSAASVGAHGSSTVGVPRDISTLADLPGYTRSLLKVRVPITVTLATKKQSLGQVLEIGPGSIIQFDKCCDDMLELEAAGHPVAEGEAVKVGDKFGLRVTALVLPGERFKAVRPTRN